MWQAGVAPGNQGPKRADGGLACENAKLVQMISVRQGGGGGDLERDWPVRPSSPLTAHRSRDAITPISHAHDGHCTLGAY